MKIKIKDLWSKVHLTLPQSLFQEITMKLKDSNESLPIYDIHIQLPVTTKEESKKDVDKSNLTVEPIRNTTHPPLKPKRSTAVEKESTDLQTEKNLSDQKNKTEHKPAPPFSGVSEKPEVKKNNKLLLVIPLLLIIGLYIVLNKDDSGINQEPKATINESNKPGSKPNQAPTTREVISKNDNEEELKQIEEARKIEQMRQAKEKKEQQAVKGTREQVEEESKQKIIENSEQLIDYKDTLKDKAELALETLKAAIEFTIEASKASELLNTLGYVSNEKEQQVFVKDMNKKIKTYRNERKIKLTKYVQILDGKRKLRERIVGYNKLIKKMHTACRELKSTIKPSVCSNLPKSCLKEHDLNCISINKGDICTGDSRLIKMISRHIFQKNPVNTSTISSEINKLSEYTINNQCMK